MPHGLTHRILGCGNGGWGDLPAALRLCSYLLLAARILRRTRTKSEHLGISPLCRVYALLSCSGCVSSWVAALIRAIGGGLSLSFANCLLLVQIRTPWLLALLRHRFEGVRCLQMRLVPNSWECCVSPRVCQDQLLPSAPPRALVPLTSVPCFSDMVQNFSVS